MHTKETIQEIIREYLVVKDVYEHLKLTACGSKLDEAYEEYLYAESRLRGIVGRNKS